MRTSIFLKIFFTFLLVTLLPILGLIAYNDWKLIYTMPQSTFFYFVNRITMHAILTTIAVVILLFFISWMITKSMLRPIYKLKIAAVKISKGEFDHPVKTSRKDELGKLVLLFEDMRKRLQSMNNTLKEVHLETIYTLIKMCRGFEKEGLVMHLLRTSEYSTVIAKHMGLDTADIFDNLTYPTDTCRPELINTYEPCTSKTDALNIILGYSGIHFDPTITNIFKQIVESNLNGNITRRYTSGNCFFRISATVQPTAKAQRTQRKNVTAQQVLFIKIKLLNIYFLKKYYLCAFAVNSRAGSGL